MEVGQQQQLLQTERVRVTAGPETTDHVDILLLRTEMLRGFQPGRELLPLQHHNEQED